MAIIFTDGFDRYNNTTGINLLTRWTSVSSASFGSQFSDSVTPYGVGQSYGPIDTAAGNVTVGFTATSTATVGAAIRVSSLNSGITYPVLSFTNSGTYQVGLTIGTSGEIKVSRQTGVGAGTLLGSSAAGVINTNAWYYIEWSFTISDTVGTMRVDVNGTNVINLTNVDTRNGTPTTVNSLVLGSNNNGNPYFDDLYLTDTTTPLGPHRIYSLNPNADTAEKDWSPTAGWLMQADVSAIATSSNATRCNIFTATGNGTINAVEVYFGAVAQTVKLGIAVLSSVTPGTVSSILYESDPVVRTATAGYYKFTFPGVSLSSGTIYAIYITRTDGTGSSPLSLAEYSGSVSQTDPNGILSFSGRGAKPDNSIIVGDTLYTDGSVVYPMGVQYTTTNNYITLAETDIDGDTSFVTASNVGDYDLYDIEAYPNATATISAVNQIVWARKTDATARTITSTIKSGATTTDSSAFTLATSYIGYSRIYETNPTTSSTWTVANINSLQIGQKVAS